MVEQTDDLGTVVAGHPCIPHRREDIAAARPASGERRE
jgi:hypothetical protein